MMMDPRSLDVPLLAEPESVRRWWAREHGMELRRRQATMRLAPEFAVLSDTLHEVVEGLAGVDREQREILVRKMGFASVAHFQSIAQTLAAGRSSVRDPPPELSPQLNDALRSLTTTFARQDEDELSRQAPSREHRNFVREMRRAGSYNWILYMGNALDLSDPTMTDCLTDTTLAQIIEDSTFVTEARRSGHKNWVLRNGRAVDLNSNEDTCMLSEALLGELKKEAMEDDFVEGATTPGYLPAIARQNPAVPLQRWEADKLMQASQQVLSALNEGRYSQGFGEALLTHLRGWQGAEAWAAAEEARVASLVQSDDAASRDELRQYIEHSLVTTLREVEKEVNRGQLADAEGASGAAASQASSAAACSSSGSGSSHARLDLEEEAALQQALLESLGGEDEEDEDDKDEQADEGEAESVGEVDEGDRHGDEEDWVAFEPFTQQAETGANLEKPEPGAQAHEESKVTTPTCQATATSEQVAEAPPAPLSARDCDHLCGLRRPGCCLCVRRAPRAGFVQPGDWCRLRGDASGEVPHGPWRFYCAICWDRKEVVEPRPTLPLAIGGTLELCSEAGPDLAGWEIVAPRAELESCLSSEDGSWVVLAAQELEEVTLD